MMEASYKCPKLDYYIFHRIILNSDCYIHGSGDNYDWFFLVPHKLYSQAAENFIRH